MKARSASAIAAVGFMLSVLQGLACMAGPSMTIASGILIGILSSYLLRFFDAGSRRILSYAMVAFSASLAGVSLGCLGTTGQVSKLFWLAPAAALLSAYLWLMFIRARSLRCGLCGAVISGGMAFQCPRCNLLVCEQACWSYEHLRCKLCEQNQVSLLGHNQEWWDRNFGPVSRLGRCEYCKQPADSTNLRTCGHCGRYQCEDCWDYLNGRCSRCRWTVAALPKQLKDLMLTSAGRKSAVQD